MNEDLQYAIYCDLEDDTFLTMRYYFNKYKGVMSKEVLANTFIEEFTRLANDMKER